MKEIILINVVKSCESVVVFWFVREQVCKTRCLPGVGGVGDVSGHLMTESGPSVSFQILDPDLLKSVDQSHSNLSL